MLARQNPGQEPHRRARIPCIQRTSSDPEPVGARSCNHNLCVAVSTSPLDADAQSLKTIKRALAIRRFGIMADFASPSCQRRQNGITVRDGLISRKLNNSGDRASRIDGLIGHEAILTRSQNTLSKGSSAVFKSKWAARK